MFERLGATLKLGRLLEQRPQRHEFSGIPADSPEKEWSYSMATHNSQRHFRILHGQKVFVFEMPENFSHEKWDKNQKYPLKRLSDLQEDDFLQGKVERKGKLTIHKSSPDELIASAGNSGFRLGRENGAWHLSPHQFQDAQTKQRDFIQAVEDHTKTGKLAKLARSIMRDEWNDKIETAGEKVETSPSKAQQEAGNYRKGHVWIQGLDLSIENPKGSVRKGVGGDGKEWKTTMANAYGYIRNYPRSGRDKDHIDVFLGEHPDSQLVFIVDQEVGGKFDEHKCLLFFTNEKDAREAYLANYSPGWKGLGHITPMDMASFKEWLKGDTSKPVFSKKGENSNGSTPSSKEGTQQKMFQNHKKNAFVFHTDSLLFPLSGRPALQGVAMGGLVGSGAGLLAHLYHQARGTVPTDSEGKPRSVWGDAWRGAAAGAAVSGLFQGARAMMGERPAGTFQQNIQNPEMTQRRLDNLPKPPLTAPDLPQLPDASKIASLDYSQVQSMVMTDPSLPAWRAQQIMSELEHARQLRIGLDPRSLAGAGLGALAGWLAGSIFGGGFMPILGAATGGMAGAHLFRTDPNMISGPGFYRP